MAIPISLGFRAQRGGAVLVGVKIEAGEPRVVRSHFLPTAAEGDQLAFEPYGVAAAMRRGSHGKASPEAADAVAEGRRRQDEFAARSLTGLVGQLRAEGYDPVSAALLINRAGWVTELLEYSLFAPEHPAVADGLAVREALRFAARACNLELVEWDEKSLSEQAWAALDLSPGLLDLRLKTLGAAAGRPWRKEQKLACLAAWLTLSIGRTEGQAR
jgi:hypothetical protein